MDNKEFFVNLIKGTIDEVPGDLSKKIKETEDNVVVNAEEACMSIELIKELLERGHLTKRPEYEEKNEDSMLVNKKRLRASLRQKSVALVLDKQIGLLWCGNKVLEDGRKQRVDKNINNINLSSVDNLLHRVKENEGVDSIDLCLDLLERQDEWGRIIDKIEKKYFEVKRIWTFVWNEQEKEQIMVWASKNCIPDDIELRFKMPSSGQFEYYDIINDNNSKEKNMSYERFKEIFSAGEQYFNCPFFYNTFFLSLDGEIDYCIDRVSNERAIDNIFTKEISEKIPGSLFDPPCSVSSQKECNFTAVCDNTCWKLSRKVKDDRFCLIKKMNENNLASIFDIKLENKSLWAGKQ